MSYSFFRQKFNKVDEINCQKLQITNFGKLYVMPQIAGLPFLNFRPTLKPTKGERGSSKKEEKCEKCKTLRSICHLVKSCVVTGLCVAYWQSINIQIWSQSSFLKFLWTYINYMRRPSLSEMYIRRVQKGLNIFFVYKF